MNIETRNSQRPASAANTWFRATAIALAVLTAGGCAASENSAKTTSDPAPTTAAPTTEPTTSIDATATTNTAKSDSMRGGRYCEVLVVNAVDGKISADVYNSWTLNDCPEDQWKALDAKAIATEQGAMAAILNGPRYWLMDSVSKVDRTSITKATFGDIDMYRLASVEVGPLADAAKPYVTHAVDRKTVFTFNAGQIVYELYAPDGSTYVMQTWSQMVDPTLEEADLADLGTRLDLPTGWNYGWRTISEPIEVATTTEPAQVLQDDLSNSYSLLTKS